MIGMMSCAYSIGPFDEIAVFRKANIFSELSYKTRKKIKNLLGP